MTSTFTATTRNTEEYRLKMCEFINKYSPVCTQITLRLVAGSIIIEGVRTATMQEIDAMCKQVPARTVIWNGDPVLGTVIIHNISNERLNGAEIIKVYKDEKIEPIFANKQERKQFHDAVSDKLKEDWSKK